MVPTSARTKPPTSPAPSTLPSFRVHRRFTHATRFLAPPTCPWRSTCGCVHVDRLLCPVVVAVVSSCSCCVLQLQEPTSTIRQFFYSEIPQIRFFRPLFSFFFVSKGSASEECGWGRSMDRLDRPSLAVLGPTPLPSRYTGWLLPLMGHRHTLFVQTHPDGFG